jgi:hypothetical protein
MRRGPALTLLAVTLAALVALAAIGLADDRGYRLDVRSESQVLIRPGQELCRGTVRSPGAGADHVRFWVRSGSDGQAPPIRVYVRRSRTSQTLADGLVEAGPAGVRSAQLTGSVAGSRKVAVCFVDVGATDAILSPRPGTRTRVAVESFEPLADYADVGVELIRGDNRSVLEALPNAFDRAALFRPGWVGAWTYWLLLAALAVGVPLLLAGALSSAAESDEDASEDSTRASS